MKKFLIPTAALLMFSACNQDKPYDATGIFEATTVTVSAETAGKIISLNIQEGDTVFAGQQVALVDTITLTLQQKQLLSQQSSTENTSPDIAKQTASLREQIAHAQQELDRQKALLASGATTQQAYDNAQAELKILTGQLHALLSTLDKNRSSISDNALALQYQREQIEEQIRKSQILAPISGTILEKYAEQGEFATIGRPLFKMANLNDIYLRCYFTASQLAGIRLGQEVTVIADFGDSKYEYSGTITWIAQECEFTPKSIQTDDTRANLVYAAKVTVKNDGRLKLGQYGEIIL